MRRQVRTIISLLLLLALVPGQLYAALQMHLSLDNTLGDASGNGNNASFFGGSPNYATSVINNGINFDGTNDYLRVNSFNAGNTFSASFWARADTLANISTFVEYVRTNRNNDFFVGYDASLGELFIELEDSDVNEEGPCGAPKFCTGISLSTNRWYHITVTVTPTTLKTYIDGELASDISHATSVAFNPGSWLVAADSDNNPANVGDSDFFDGRLDEVKIFNHELSQTEVSNLMNLSGWWRLDECTLANPGDVIDSSFNGNNGNPVNGVTTDTGRICNAGLFDGTDDYIDIAHNPLLNGTSALTYSAWINPNTWAGSIRQIMAKSVHGGGSGRAQMGIFSEGGILKGRAETSSGRHEVTAALPALNVWSQVVLVFQGTTLQLYINGNLVNQTTLPASTLNSTTDALNISKRVGTAQYFFDGMIDEVKVFQRALSAEEVADYYTTPDPIGRTCPDCGPGTTANNLVLSTDATETLGGLTFTNGSLAEYDATADSATLFFNENLFAGNENIDASHVLSDGNIILSTTSTATLGGLTFRSGDLAEYDPTADTATLFFNANNFTNNENIDAVYVQDNGNILLSTTGSAQLGGLSFRDGDVVEYDPGADSATLFFSEDNFSGGADVNGVHLFPNGNLLITTNNTETLGGLTFTDGSVAEYDPTTDTATLYFDENLFSNNADVNAVSVRPTVTPLHHILIEHDGSALTCNPEDITIKACADANCTALLSTSVTVTLTPTGWVGGDTVVVTSGSGTFQLRQSLAQTVSLGVSNTTPIATNPFECLDTSTASSSCNLTYYDTGFVYTIPNQTSCATSANIGVAAVRLDNTTQQCIPAFANRNETINFWNNYLSPASGSNNVTLNNGATDFILANSAPGSAVPLSFNANGEATITVTYPDAGQLSLNSGFTGSGAESGLVMNGTETYAVVPAKFYVYSDDVNSDCAAANLSCSRFRQAGQAFNLKVRAACSDNSVTPNFQHNGISITHTLVAPLGGNTGTIGNNAFDMLPADSGEHVISDQSVSEVGVFSYSAQLSGGTSYFGATSIGTAASNTSVNIGRFYPAYFDVTRIHGCAAGAFTYSGQPFSVTATAFNSTGVITQNYDGGLAFAFDATLSDSGDASNFSNNTISASNFSAGLGTRADVTYTFPLVTTAPSIITLRAIDTDSTSSLGYLEETTTIHSGRVAIENAFGSELIDLSVPTTVQHYDGSNFVAFSTDVCTTMNLSLTKIDGNLTLGNGTAAGQTCIWDDAGNSGTFNCSANPSKPQYIEPPVNADFNLYLKAPGAGFTGNVDVTGLVDSWLQFDWTGSGASNPVARATFGIYRGDDRIIYWREKFE